MTGRPKLSVVGPEATEAADWSAESILRQWDPEAQLIGALMHLSATKAVPLLTLVPDTAIWRPDNRWAYEIIGHLVDIAVDPDPVVVLHTAGGRPPADATHPREPASPRTLHRFAVHLAELYTRTVTPSMASQYAREVLDNAYRRAVKLHGTRMAQLAETGALRGELTEYLTAMRAELADLWRRAEAVSQSQ